MAVSPAVVGLGNRVGPKHVATTLNVLSFTKEKDKQKSLIDYNDHVLALPYMTLKTMILGSTCPEEVHHWSGLPSPCSA